MSGGTRVSTSETAPWKEQQGYLMGGFEQAKNVYNRGVPEYYPGETIAGFDPAQTAAQQATLGYVMGPRAAGQQSAAEASLVQGLSGQVDPNAYNPIASALTDTVTSNLQKNILPGLRQNQVRFQPGGSSRGDMVNNRAISSAVTSGLTKPLADIYTNAYNQAQQRAVQSGNLYPSIMGAPISMYNAMGQVGDRRQALTQGQMDADMARYAYQSEAPYNALNQFMNTISGNYGSSSVNTTPGPSGLQTMGQIAQIAAPFIGSDIRIKENIVPEGARWKGLQIYQYNYRGDPTPRRGVMAQEVEKVRPDAVTTIGGIKHVNYGAL